jgi:hypothetical protein
MNRVFSVIVFAILWASTASATTPTQVRNVADPTHHPYEEFANVSCTSNGVCEIVFPALTTTSTVILHASCGFSLATGGFPLYASLGEKTSNPRNYLQTFAYGNDGNITNFGINADTYLFYTKGQQPTIIVFGDGATVQSLLCTVSGYYF